MTTILNLVYLKIVYVFLSSSSNFVLLIHHRLVLCITVHIISLIITYERHLQTTAPGACQFQNPRLLLRIFITLAVRHILTMDSETSNSKWYDLIVVGSGNGACGFLSKCLKHNISSPPDILVLEQGRNFFYTSTVTHQDNWAKSFAATNRIFQLHNAKTPR